MEISRFGPRYLPGHVIIVGVFLGVGVGLRLRRGGLVLHLLVLAAAAALLVLVVVVRVVRYHLEAELDYLLEEFSQLFQ